MTYAGAVIMGIIQGVTEFLPISSSAHLAIFSQLLGFSAPGEHDLVFDIMLHLGTLIAVVAAYKEDIAALLKEFFSALVCLFAGRFSFKNMSDTRRFLVMLTVSTLPLFAAMLLEDAVESVSNNLTLIGVFLAVTGILLILSDRVVKGTITEGRTTFGKALTVGLFQCCALFPGISRSGATITGGLLVGFKREYAVKYSFIMSLPAILGACAVSAANIAKGQSTSQADIPVYLTGIAVSAAVGYLCIYLLRIILKHDKFKYFAYYLFAMSAFLIIRAAAAAF